MLCESCGERNATVKYTQMIDGELSRFRLCEKCAAEKGAAASIAPIADSLMSILMGLLDEGGELESSEAEGQTCAACGLSYAQFRRDGLLGCGVCYESFADELRPLLSRIHGSTRHEGKLPGGIGEDVQQHREIKKLMREQEQAVRREEYERAAELRDLIREKEKALREHVVVRSDDE
jgi:protein arginine kinase activator